VGSDLCLAYVWLRSGLGKLAGTPRHVHTRTHTSIRFSFVPFVCMLRRFCEPFSFRFNALVGPHPPSPRGAMGPFS